MAHEEDKNNNPTDSQQQQDTATSDSQETTPEQDVSNSGTEQPNAETALKKEAEELKDKYLRLYSEFDNFRRRTAKEKSDLIKSASEDLLSSLIPILDDFERAKKSMDAADKVEPIKEGVDLIHNKLYKTLESKGLKPMESPIGKPFDSELQEAVTQAPAPSDDLKGKVIDEIEKGYYLHDKVIRFSKVIIGS